MSSTAPEAEAFAGKAGRAPAIALDLEGLDFGGARILDALRLEVGERETVAITGPSGIGKTTLLRILAEVETGFRGRLVPAKRLAMVFQEPRLLPWRSAVDNLILTAGVTRGDVAPLLDRVRLGGKGAQYPSELSLGQQRRLSLARAFAMRPTLLLMDEPFVSLDADLAAEMRALFVRLRDESGVATVLVTHDLEEARALADRVLRLEGAPARLAGPAR